MLLHPICFSMCYWLLRYLASLTAICYLAASSASLCAPLASSLLHLLPWLLYPLRYVLPWLLRCFICFMLLYPLRYVLPWLLRCFLGFFAAMTYKLYKYEKKRKNV